MNVEITNQTSTSTTLLVTADKKELDAAKKKILTVAAKSVKIDGFRKGKAPLKEVEKNVDNASLGNDFLNEIVPGLATSAMDEKKVSSVVPPEVNVTKFVPFTALEVEVKTHNVGEVKLADYKKLKRSKPKVEVTDEDVDAVLKRIQMDLAERKDVDRKSKDGDQVWIDFKGVDADGKEVNGASGDDYPLVLGSSTFIPGFEENLVGFKPGDNTTFTLTFPKDYGVATLAGSDVTFTCHVKKVQEVIIPEINDDLAKQVGPYKTKKEFLADVDKQLLADKERKAMVEVESDFMAELVEKSEVELPDVMIDEQLNRMVQDQMQNLQYRGVTYDDWLKDQKLTPETHRAGLRDEAIKRLQGGVVLSEIAKAEGIDMSEEEIDQAVESFKQQYASDPQMQAQLAQPEARRDVAARVLTDRTLTRLRELIIK